MKLGDDVSTEVHLWKKNNAALCVGSEYWWGWGLRTSDSGAAEGSAPPSQSWSENKPALHKARGHTHTHTHTHTRTHEELKGDHALEEY